MTKQAKKKLCWSCEGRVTKEAENCPYCGVYLSPNGIDGTSPSTIWDPPYKLSSDEENQTAPSAPYTLPREENMLEAPLDNSSTIKSVLTPLVLLLSGSVFFVFGLILYLFSTNGTLTLRWDASYWYLYIGLAMPLLIYGWKTLSDLK